MNVFNFVRVAQQKTVWKNLPSIICDRINFCVLNYAIPDACVGDSGGPWMQVASTDNGPRYYLTGVVSMGPERCGAGIGVYTGVSAHMMYILDRLN